MIFWGFLLRFVLRAFGVLAVESEEPTGPPASMTYRRPSSTTGLHHVGWPAEPAGKPEPLEREVARVRRREDLGPEASTTDGGLW